MKKKKILHVLGGLYCGGTETFVMNMFRAIDKEKFQFEFLIHEKLEAHYDKEVLELGGRIHRIPDRTEVGTIKYLIILIKTLYKISPDVVHSHAMFNSGAVMFASFFTGVKKRIVHSHNSADQYQSFLYRKVFRFIMRLLIRIFSSELLACSKDAARYLYGNKCVNLGKTFVLNNAIDVKQFQYKKAVREKVRRDLNIEEKFVIGHIGRFNKQKNHDFLIEVFRELNGKNPNTVLIMIGEGPLKPNIEKKVKELGLSSAVKFLGVRSDISRLMQAMDLFMLPSLFEGFPVVLTEAQGSGLFCIVADTITKDVNITGRIKFLDIKDSPEKWTKEILLSNYKHIDTSDIIKDKGFDNYTNAMRLGEIYTN
jgi:glycosyltransferase involved in cell wall biosynthesis